MRQGGDGVGWLYILRACDDCSNPSYQRASYHTTAHNTSQLIDFISVDSCWPLSM